MISCQIISSIINVQKGNFIDANNSDVLILACMFYVFMNKANYNFNRLKSSLDEHVKVKHQSTHTQPISLEQTIEKQSSIQAAAKPPLIGLAVKQRLIESIARKQSS